MLVGDFDSPERVSMQKMGRESINTPEFKAINLRSAHEAIVLLRNSRGLLPLHGNYKRIAVIGANANSTVVFTGDYEGLADHIYTLLEGVSLRAPKAEVRFAAGCRDIFCNSTELFDEAISLARTAEVVILGFGTDKNAACERDDLMETTCEGVSIGATQLPGCQGRLFESILRVNPNVVLVGMSGQQLNNPQSADTVLFAPFLGNFGGLAIADVLFGRFNVGGRLPFTLYKETERLPPIESYDMTSYPGRTYRYHRLEPEFPFGFGLSYSSFAYSGLRVSQESLRPCESLVVEVNVRNEGPCRRESDE